MQAFSGMFAWTFGITESKGVLVRRAVGEEAITEAHGAWRRLQGLSFFFFGGGDGWRRRG
jgi:hypothetical protein